MPVLLIADDSAGKRIMLRALAHRHWRAATIVEATTSEEAMAVIGGATQLDAAFVDYYIPTQPGPVIIQAVKAKFPAARVALVSSADRADNAAEARAAGAEAVVCSTAADAEGRLSDLLIEWAVA
jgi:DNA-binding NarL/FixJ family response regulator